MDIEGEMFKAYFNKQGCTDLPPKIMKYLNVNEGEKVDFELTAPGLIILRKGEPL